jgi:hypothetical protein
MNPHILQNRKHLFRLGVLAAAVFVAGSVTGCGPKSDQSKGFYHQCVTASPRSLTFYYEGKAVDWTSYPFSVELMKICYAKSQVFDGGQLSRDPIVSENEYRLWLLDQLTDRELRFLDDLRKMAARD